jgi:hypothetical protein
MNDETFQGNSSPTFRRKQVSTMKHEYLDSCQNWNESSHIL